MMNSNLFSAGNYDERFLRFFNCTEPHNRFFKKFKKPSLKKFKKKLKIVLNLFLGALQDGMKKKRKFDHRSTFEFRAPFIHLGFKPNTYALLDFFQHGRISD